jgi:hypothetical protein
MYATIADPKTIDMYAGIRGGYAIGDNIKDRNIELPSAGYGKLDIVGGLKKDYKAFSKLIFSGKVYLGLSAIDTGTEFDSSMGTVSGVEERGIIVGAGFALNYNLLPQMYLYTGLNSQTDSFSKSYSFYLGLNCKFGQEQIKSKPKARERERESKN